MAFPDIAPDLLALMPNLKGKLVPNRSLAELTSFGVGGPAQIMFEPKSEHDLTYFLSKLPGDIPISVIGFGFNVLVRDGGIEGVVIRLGNGFKKIDIVNETYLAVDAGASNGKVASRAQRAGIAGFAFLSGIPGGIGGSLRMNSGGYGREIKDIFVSARGIDRAGIVHELSESDMLFSYRHCGVPEDIIFVHALLKGTRSTPPNIAQQMDVIKKLRKQNQPLTGRSAGSTFKNPLKAWELIDAAGCRGLREGGACVSELHCNFLLNDRDATAQDIESLGEIVRQRVKAALKVELHWEVRRMGSAAEPIEVTSAHSMNQHVKTQSQLDELVEQQFRAVGGNSLADFVARIAGGGDAATETFVVVAKAFAMNGDYAGLSQFFNAYFSAIHKDAQADVAHFFAARAFFP